MPPTPPNPMDARRRLEITRRHFFANCGVGVGKIALGTLLGQQLLGGSSAASASQAPSNPLATRQPHFAPTAKRVIFLFMAGGPSQLDLFDEKPKLHELAGSSLPKSVTEGQRLAFTDPDAAVLAPQYEFAKHGQSGTKISSVMPHLAEVVDEIAMVKSLYTDQFNHAPAQIFLNTGDPLPGRPSLGSWVTYGLGNMTENLPSFVVLSSGNGTSGGRSNYSSGFMPSDFAGVPFRSAGDPVINVSNPAGVDRRLQRDSLDAIASLNRRHHDQLNDPEITARINAYEMAFRLQTSAPELMDFNSESKQTLEMYGAKPGEASFANNCLMARRLAERGVRFIACFHEGWDHHSDVKGGLKGQCGITDQPSAALIKDLKQRGMLEDTLVIWGGEFGRTPMVEAIAALGRTGGRDHHPQAFSMWMAGGGIKGGISVGETDELGYNITEDPIHVHDLQATILHLLGLNHERLTYTYQGRQFRLTDVHGHVVEKLLV